jgi:hypothetical protein
VTLLFSAESRFVLAIKSQLLEQENENLRSTINSYKAVLGTRENEILDLKHKLTRGH